MSTNDLTDVMAIEKKSHTDPWSEEGFLNELRNPAGRSFVIHQGKSITGYVVFWIIADETHLLNLTVHPGCRGHGLGRKLLAFLISYSRRHGVTWVGLEVRRSNRVATALYRSFGFQEGRVRKAYYPDTREDGLIMELGLNRETTSMDQ